MYTYSDPTQEVVETKVQNLEIIYFTYPKIHQLNLKKILIGLKYYIFGTILNY